MKKVAIFVDWENLRLDIANIQRKNKNISFNYNNIDDVSQLIYSAIHDKTEEIYRVFFYTAEPLCFDELKKDKKNKALMEKYEGKDPEKYKKMEKLRKQILSFIQNIAFKDHFAVRLGDLKFRGFDSDGKPIIAQKQVDMLLGLDISHLAYQKLVDRIIVFCKDSDISPALKCARTNGLDVVIASVDGGFKVGNILKKHSDSIREIQLLPSNK
ncbi:hypothetical protein CQA49_08205 [Helicobacter sp. MIT 00-7814]|uniref:NYN domain-containing protein n=1 Tax=unclassified Helicobacter TaxID=2593540 RepID=UPI000E1F511A|nr:MULTISPECIES: NYN domain-containing protein [unclassified Helicobacter]RDU51596.1 hypothetical protein CQA37_09570 [Helicobacter sp. MIT 99-10781]RDU52532.1 hypothetical protein CQA49_08205 [Helicobacter sp. MIT 00-7814]